MTGLNDADRPWTFPASEALLDRALGVIPLGSQTFSKSLTQYPRGVSPFFVERGEGAWCWDADGHRYLDMVNALAAVTLGHADPDVNEAVARQLRDGTIFSLPHRLEAEVAERIVAMVPCAERVRFGKNGSDATSGAIRAARAFTGRDHIAMCGYHGWQDWSIGTTARHKGVPAAVRALTHTFPFGDLPALGALLASRPGGFAAVVLEPMNVAEPPPGYLQGVVDLAHAHGALAIFDETITGFRFANGGAQQLFAVTPDLATFGKGIANGFPLAAVAGRADVMAEFEEIFFSFTMGGETLSLAAARAVLDKLEREPVTAHLASIGARMLAGTRALIDKHGCGDFLAVGGHPSWGFLFIRDAEGATSFEIKTLWMQEILSRGVLSVGTHNVSYAMGDGEVERLLAVYDAVFPILAAAVRDRRIRQYLRCPPLEPLFKVR